jgi:hypothetical protein
MFSLSSRRYSARPQLSDMVGLVGGSCQNQKYASQELPIHTRMNFQVISLADNFIFIGGEKGPHPPHQRFGPVPSG